MPEPLAPLPPAEKRREKRVSRRLRWVLPALIAVGFIALSLFWSSRIYMAQQATRENQIAACERGNVIRRHIALLEGVASVKLPDDLEIIVLYDCNSLR